jgi:hypothetical protein
MCAARPRTSLATGVVDHSWHGLWCCAQHRPWARAVLCHKPTTLRPGMSMAELVHGQGRPWPRTALAMHWPWTALQSCRARARAPRAHERRSLFHQLASAIWPVTWN